MRLEGWQQVSAVHPSFETRACGALLRMRLNGAKHLFLGVFLGVAQVYGTPRRIEARSSHPHPDACGKYRCDFLVAKRAPPH